MNRNVSIVFTGGGSGGHVMPALTLIKSLRKKDNYSLFYIGGSGIEKNLCEKEDIDFKEIATGKLRRYFSWQNFIDQLRILKGFFQSLNYLRRFNCNDTLLFAVGGFVEVPVVLAAWILRIPVFIHEQTTRMGLANKISSHFAKKIFVSFEDSLDYFPEGRTFFSGYPLREACYTKEISEKVFGIDLKHGHRPILFITGGGNGSKLLNDYVKASLEELKEKYLIFHQVGKSFIEEYVPFKNENYYPLDFVQDEMLPLMYYSNIVLSRSGAGTVCELMTLRKRSIYVPLKIAQKNEQYHNAIAAQKSLGSVVISEDELANKTLIQLLEEFQQIKDELNETQSGSVNGTAFLLNEIDKQLQS